jgi:aryl-alcohol dehydrogenase-like predicted oxidoreductase
MLSRYLNLYQIHSVTVDGGVLDNAHILTELARLRAEGLCVGLTVTGPRQAEAVRKAVDARVDGQPLFATVQATWNLMERSAGPALAEAHAAGMGVVVKEALANGRLTERNTFRSFAGSLALLRGEAERLGAGVDALAMAAVLAQPWADVVLSGAATREHLLSNLRALDTAWDDEAAYYTEPVCEHPEQYWEARGRLPWN